MKEVIFKKPPESTPSEHKCIACGSPLYYETIECPDGIKGCLVMHYGYVCHQCGKVWQ